MYSLKAARKASGLWLPNACLVHALSVAFSGSMGLSRTSPQSATRPSDTWSGPEASPRGRPAAGRPLLAARGGRDARASDYCFSLS